MLAIAMDWGLFDTQEQVCACKMARTCRSATMNTATEALTAGSHPLAGKRMTGAEMVVQVLADEGVDTIFGYPGGAVLDVYNELFNFPLKHILVRHEQAAVHGADGYARATGRPDSSRRSR